MQSTDLESQAQRIRDSLPESGLFADKAWRVSPQPFPLDKMTLKRLTQLGPVFYKFQRTLDLFYRRSVKGTLPSWISDYLDQGKPTALLDTARSSALTQQLPRVIRPDLILTETGFAASELDSVPGGIGLTGWLAEVYADSGHDIVGGTYGMQRGFQSMFRDGGADIVVSEEAADYLPEMQWLAPRLEGDYRVERAESYQPTDDREIYRFYELFDLPNIPRAQDWGARGLVTSPHKPWLEEKMGSALFWSLPLREHWRQELGSGYCQKLRDTFPRSWVVDPAELPHQAGIPGLDIQHFSELRDFSQKQRELVLKLSGFNEKAWGSRSVTIGHDASQAEWSAAVDEALASYGTSPYVLQTYHHGRLVEHPWWNEETGQIEIMTGRVRLCPYYFVDAKTDRVNLGGVLATICPADKKIIHGMSEAILVPCCVV